MRSGLLNTGVVPKFVSLLADAAISEQHAAARSLGNFIMDGQSLVPCNSDPPSADGRKMVKDCNGLQALIQLLSAVEVEARRAACLAIGTCSRDRRGWGGGMVLRFRRRDGD